MDKTLTYLGAGMIIFELLVVILYFLTIYVSWTLHLLLSLIVGSMVLIFNVTAVVFIIVGLFSDRRKY